MSLPVSNFHFPVSSFQFQISNFQFQISPLLTPNSMSLALTTRTGKREAGVALLAVLSAVSVMLLVALALAGSVQIETRTAIYRKEATQAYALAAGGVEFALLEIAYPPPADQQDRPPVWIEGQRLLRVPYAHGVALVEIVNETGKLDLNAASREQLAGLFEARGLKSVDAVRLAAAINHWRNPPGSDDQESKALDDDYRDAGYSPAHRPFASVEEALRVRGMSRDIFDGTAEFSPGEGIQYKYGVGQDLTIYSQSSQVNVNYASEEVLLSVPGMNEELAGSMVAERRRKPFKSTEEIARRLAMSLPDKAVPTLTTGVCPIYSIISVGGVNGSRVRRSVKAVVQVTPNGTPPQRIIAWYDDVTE
jgi:general secretion pathway protein K